MTAAIVLLAGCGANPPPVASPPPAASPPPTSAPVDHEETLTVDGRQRSFIVHVPAGRPAGVRSPAVIVFHGGGGNARNAIEQTGMSAQADLDGFLAVYPYGTGRQSSRQLTWNAGACCGYAVDERVDDVAFVAALIDHLESRYGADPRRIFLTGMSNGGMMSYRLACELSERIAAIAPVAGSMANQCRPSAPVSVVAFHGTADRHVPYDGGAPPIKADPHPRIDPPVSDTIAFWAGHNRCSAPATAPAGADITHQTQACPGGVEVALYTIQGGAHTWPASATQLMSRFFRQHPAAR